MKIKNKNLKRNNICLLFLLSFIITNVFVGFNGFSKGIAEENIQDNNYYYNDFKTKEDLSAGGVEVNKQILGEGITMLKNENNALPLAENSKISIFGKSSTSLVYGGQGSGSGNSGASCTLKSALEQAGFQVNPTLTSFYQTNSQSGNGGGGLSGYKVNAGLATGETPISKYTSNIENTYKDYNDAAIIVLSRRGGESVDLPKSMSSGFDEKTGELLSTPVSGARSIEDHYLQPDKNETDLIKYVGDRFEKVIIVFNTSTTMEAGFLDDATHYAYHKNIKAAFWIGLPGKNNGLYAFGDILKGKISPSGHTVDTYARDFKKDPTWCNLLTHNNLEHRYTNQPTESSLYAFVDYDEGIYSGYRYYETRGYVEKEKGNTDWYKNNVIYPLGYGLSYSNFSWQLLSSSYDEGATLPSDGIITYSVKVTNTGAYDAKDVVEMYYTAPYITGQIEKSHVVLGDFAKTKLLKPGESDTVTLTMSVRDMASYDYNDANHNQFKGYELDPGSYNISICKDAHTPIASKNFNVSENIQYAKDSATGNNIENLFDDVSDKIQTYMSRADFEGTFPQAPTEEERQFTDKERQQSLVHDYTNDSPDDPWYTAEMPKTGNNTGDIKLDSLRGLDYTDPQWDAFIQQIAVGDWKTPGLTNLVFTGAWNFKGISGVGIKPSLQFDGPSGLNPKSGQDKNNGLPYNTDFANESCLASTWNKDLAYKKGNIIGNEALMGRNYGQIVNGYYAPAVNIHRSPFSGRNFEYFSEDPTLTGKMAGQIIKGCNEKGVITMLKHFALNDQETARDWLFTWANEQSMREIYYKCFEICIKDYHSHGLMTSLNSVGGTWAGANYNLLTKMLREEWGYDGIVHTDYIQGRGNLPANQTIRTGGDTILTGAVGKQVPTGLDQPTTVACLQRAVKNLCYNLVNYSNIVNTSNEYVFKETSKARISAVIKDAPYSQSVAVAKLNNNDTEDKITYSLKEGSSLPTGLTLTSDGKIEGTCTEESTNNNFTVVAKYGSAKQEFNYTLSVVDGEKAIVYEYDDELSKGIIGQSYQQNIATAHTMGTKQPQIKYALSEESLLPEGLSLSVDGVITGQPTKNCIDYKFSVTAYGTELSSMTKEFSITILDKMQFESKTMKTGEYSKNYAFNIATVKVAGVKYSLKAGSTLPTGLSLTEGGMVYGKAGKAVYNHKFTVVASINGYENAEAEFTLSILPNYKNIVLEDGVLGEEYSGEVNIAQGMSGITYQLVEGDLPKGLMLEEDGTISGTPQQAGNFEIKVAAKVNDQFKKVVTIYLYIANF